MVRISVRSSSEEVLEQSASSLVLEYPDLKRTDVVQVKYTNPVRVTKARTIVPADRHRRERESMLLSQN